MSPSEDRLKGELTAALAQLKQAAQEHRRRREAARHPSVLRHMLDGARALLAGLDRELRAAGLPRIRRSPKSPVDRVDPVVRPVNKRS